MKMMKTNIIKSTITPLEDYIDEAFKIGKSSKIFKYKFKPKDRSELVQLIDEHLKEQKDADTIDLNDIDTSMIKNFSELFKASSYNDTLREKNFDVSNWDLSSAVNTEYMFTNCQKFNCDLSGWNVSKVKLANDMFNGCIEFNQDLSNWNTTSLKESIRMFYGCKKLNQDFSTWDMSSCDDVTYMFAKCPELDQDFSKWKLNDKCLGKNNIFWKSEKMKDNLPEWAK